MIPLDHGTPCISTFPSSSEYKSPPVGLGFPSLACSAFFFLPEAGAPPPPEGLQEAPLRWMGSSSSAVSNYPRVTMAPPAVASLGILIKSGPPVAYVIGIPIGAQVSLLVSVPLISKQRIIRSSHFPPNASIK